MPLYIHEFNEVDGVSAYYGPFPEEELDERINDEYAESLAMLGGELDVVELTEDEIKDLHINSPEFWMKELANLTS